MTPRIALLLITALGAALRFYKLDAQSIWFDEAFSLAHSVRPIPELIAALLQDRVHPPLHYLLLHFWFPLAGFSPASARALSALLGTLSIPALYLLARRFTAPAPSLCAAFLLAISQLAVYFSQEARPYVFVQLLTLLAAIAFLCFLENPAFPRALAFTAAGTALAYTHYYGSAALLAFGVYWLLFRHRYPARVFPRLAASALAIAAALFPWLLAVHITSTKEQVVHDPPSLVAPLHALNRLNNGKFVSIEDPTPVPLAALGILVFTLPALFPFLRRNLPESRAAVFAWLLTLFPIAFALLGGALGMIFNYRHFSFVAPAYSLAVAIGWSLAFPTPPLRWAWLGVASLLSAFALRASFTVPTKTDYRAAFQPLSRSYQAGDCIANRPNVWRNQVHLAWQVLHPTQPLRLVPFTDTPTPPPDCARLWIVFDKTPFLRRRPDESGFILRTLTALGSQFAITAEFTHPVLDIHLLRRRSSTLPATTPPDPSAPPSAPAPHTQSSQ